MSKKKLKVAFSGNPNSGKSTLFNALTGLNQQVGNYPGITVDKKTGSCNVSDKVRAEVIDLPGTYSLYPKSLDEKVTQQILCNKDNKDYPDVTVVVADSSNNTSEVIDRNEFVADIFIKPARSINFITLNFTATRTGISFDEVA